MMRLTICLAVSVALIGFSARAQNPGEWSPPPMVPANPPPTPPPALTPGQPGTPPPPGGSSAPAYLPNTASPYGQPRENKKPGPEVGLMVSESLFGMLTAAGVTILPYFLLFGSGQSLGDPTISSVIFVLIFSAVPLAVAQTQVSLANGSRHYASEQWPAALAGLAAQAAVLGLYYASGWLPQGQASGGIPRSGGSTELLLIGSIVAVPLIQMAIINLTKEPKMRFSAVELRPGEGLSLGVPMPSPIISSTRQGPAFGVNVPLLSGRF